jgi:hypothetical protein
MKLLRLTAALTLIALVSACASTTPVARQDASRPVEQVIVYPASGQTEGQMDRDRYECHLWSVRQSNYDPSRVPAGYRQRYEVRAAPPASQIPGTAIVGAIIGAAVSGPRDAGSGALVGAAAGAVIGAAADDAAAQRANRFADRSRGALDRRADDYRRALTACLEGRGYTVR